MYKHMHVHDLSVGLETGEALKLYFVKYVVILGLKLAISNQTKVYINLYLLSCCDFKHHTSSYKYNSIFSLRFFAVTRWQVK